MKAQHLLIVVSFLFLANANTKSSISTEIRLLMKFRNGIHLNSNTYFAATGITRLDSLNEIFDCISMEPLIPILKHHGESNPLDRTWIFKFKTESLIEHLTIAYSNSGLFDYIEPDCITRSNFSGTGFFPNDQLFSFQWALHNDASFNMSGRFNPKDDADIDMPEAWELEQGDSSVIIAILDSGCKMDFPELSQSIWKNDREVPDNGIDDDGNGYVDDINGWDFINDDNDPDDDDGHGTAITGIIASKTNNYTGLAGINANARVMVVKVLDSSGAGLSSITAKGIDYAVRMGAKVINISIRLSNATQTSYNSIRAATEKNVTIVAGTGNDNMGKIYFPAAYEEVIAVGGSGPDDKRYAFSATAGSNYGPEIDIVAPAAYIFILDNKDKNNFSLFANGTSLSTAFVTGVVSLLLSKNLALTCDQIRGILRNSADDKVGDPSEDTEGWDKYFGWGRLNAHKALTLATSVRKRDKKQNPKIYNTQPVLNINRSLPVYSSRYITLNGRLSPVKSYLEKISAGVFISLHYAAKP